MPEDSQNIDRESSPDARENPAVQEALSGSVLSEGEQVDLSTSTLNDRLMEVHHHPDLHHEKKFFKEYLLEFLMIFLAVTLGFFAESFREHLNEKSREIEYMESMVEDLRIDTANMQGTIQGWKSILSRIDKMMSAIRSAHDTNNVKLLYKINAEQFFLFQPYPFNDRTVEQLKSSGSYRMIRNKKVIDSILIFDNNSHADLATIAEDLRRQLYALKEVEKKVLDYGQIRGEEKFGALTLHTGSSPMKDSLALGPGNKTRKAVLLTNQPSDLVNYYNSLYIYWTLGNYYSGSIDFYKERASQLIKLIRSEYEIH